jgi:hypothetical protein
MNINATNGEQRTSINNAHILLLVRQAIIYLFNYLFYYILWATAALQVALKRRSVQKGTK